MPHCLPHIDTPSSVYNHTSLASSSNGVDPVFVRFISLIMISGLLILNSLNNSFVSCKFFSTHHSVGVSHEYKARSPSAHFVERFIIASTFLSLKVNILFSSPAVAIPSLALFSLSDICSAFSTVLFNMLTLFTHLFASSSAIPLAVHPAHNIIIFLFCISIHISLNLSHNDSTYQEASELYPCISVQK
ncbi:MAG: hypothetical protein WCI00_04900 [bacterium]